MISELEARAMFEKEYPREIYDDYDRYQINLFIEIYKDVAKHIGFKDKRRDDRYVVKFHDIFYCMPDEKELKEGEQAVLDELFEDFCQSTYDNLEEDVGKDVINAVVEKNKRVGSYSPLLLTHEYKITEITEENAYRIADKLYIHDYGDETDIVSKHVRLVEELQKLEDTYMNQWIDYIGEYSEISPDVLSPETVQRIKDKYEEDKAKHKD